MNLLAPAGYVLQDTVAPCRSSLPSPPSMRSLPPWYPEPAGNTASSLVLLVRGIFCRATGKVQQTAQQTLETRYTKSFNINRLHNHACRIWSPYGAPPNTLIYLIIFHLRRQSLPASCNNDPMMGRESAIWRPSRLLRDAAAARKGCLIDWSTSPERPHRWRLLLLPQPHRLGTRHLIELRDSTTLALRSTRKNTLEIGCLAHFGTHTLIGR